MRSTNGPTFEPPLLADRHTQAGMQYLHLRRLTLLSFRIGVCPSDDIRVTESRLSKVQRDVHQLPDPEPRSSRRVSRGKSEVERRSLPRSGFHPDSTSVPLDG